MVSWKNTGWFCGGYSFYKVTFSDFGGLDLDIMNYQFHTFAEEHWRAQQRDTVTTGLFSQSDLC